MRRREAGSGAAEEVGREEQKEVMPDRCSLPSNISLNASTYSDPGHVF